jgi:hypothetical protein
MDAAWIKVVVLTLAECVAPEGKTVCQEQQVQYNFVDEAECQKVLEQLIDYRDGFENVIVNKADSSCQPASKSLEIFQSRSDADPGFVDEDGYVVVEGEGPKRKDFMQERHDLRLQSLPVCDDSQLVTPCKRGEIIIESVSENKTEVWKQDR